MRIFTIAGDKKLAPRPLPSDEADFWWYEELGDNPKQRYTARRNGY